MLVFTRNSDESVIVGGPSDFERVLKITVLEINGGRVKLGVSVMDEGTPDRWCVWERIRRGDE